jgi:hypothetical protein
LEFIMSVNKSLLSLAAIASLSLLSAGAAIAQDATPDYARAQTVTSKVTRADVQAEAAAFFASPTPSPWSSKFSIRSQVVASPQTRVAVKAETLRALQNHEVVDSGEVFYILPARPAQFAGLTR